MNVWKCKLIFPTDKLQQNIEITDLKKNLAAENTYVLIILATTMCDYMSNIYIYIYIYTHNYKYLICLYIPEDEEFPQWQQC